jgi:predicted ATPase
VPLFIEQITLSMLEAQERATWSVGRGRRVPRTLLELLSARLDSFADARHGIQGAAIFGGAFTLPLLAQVINAPQASGVRRRLTVPALW